MIRGIAMTDNRAPMFETRGVNHVALVCSDMAGTVDFYEGVLGFPLFKTVQMGPDGQHFFFDIGNGASLAFMWFRDAEPAAPGIASQHPDHYRSAVASMNHIALDVPLERIDEYHQKLTELGIETHLINHDDSARGASAEVHPGTWIRSLYFWDPDGIRLEFAAYARAFSEADVAHPPVKVDGVPSALSTSS
jgi:catechol 2,3-dioxygenase-like lactoylglutathione lyase family enzyme